jgi:hypothetical protein
MLPLTLQFLIAMIASAINERLQRKLDYALEEVRVLKEILRDATGKDRIAFSPQRLPRSNKHQHRQCPAHLSCMSSAPGTGSSDCSGQGASPATTSGGEFLYLRTRTNDSVTQHAGQRTCSTYRRATWRRSVTAE